MVSRSEAAGGCRRLASRDIPRRASAATVRRLRQRPARRALRRQAALRAPQEDLPRRLAGRRLHGQCRQVPRCRRADGRAYLQRLRPREGCFGCRIPIINSSLFSLLSSYPWLTLHPSRVK